MFGTLLRWDWGLILHFFTTDDKPVFGGAWWSIFLNMGSVESKPIVYSRLHYTPVYWEYLSLWMVKDSSHIHSDRYFHVFHHCPDLLNLASLQNDLSKF